jgi:small-conductance mechanosensitive channel
MLAAATLGGVYLLLAAIRLALVRRFGTVSARTATHWDDLVVEIIRRTRWYFMLLIAVHAATRVIPPNASAARVLGAITVVLVLLQAGHWGNGVIGFGADYYARQRAPSDTGTRTTIHAVGYAVRFMLWGLLVVTALQNFGIDVTALVTGLGIGGIAIALAIQNILGDLFAALAIVLDKPFVVGDAVQVDAINGTIEHVGLKTTRIRSLSGEQVIVSNADLLKSRIRNYKRMELRRAAFTLDVAFDTAPDKLAAIPGIVKQIVERQAQTRFDRSHLLAIAETGLRFENVYYVLNPDYNLYADVQHAIHLELLRRFQRDQIQLGYATRTVQLQSSPTPSPS